MPPPSPMPAEAACNAAELRLPGSVPIPRYLEKVYWWAYVHPRAVHLFEREWLVNLILFGNYGQLRDLALAELGAPIAGRTLQLACVYGNLTQRLCASMATDACLDVIDILPIQLTNLRAKLAPDARLTIQQGDASSLAWADSTFDQILLFFLLHEQPEAVRRATLAEALRVVRPGGKVVIVDYHRPVRWHPMRPLMRQVFRKLEPYAMDLWEHEIEHFLPPDAGARVLDKRTCFGALYQKLVLTR